MSRSVVTVGGLPGSGTTTTCILLEQRTGLSHVNIGTIFRTMATERGMSLNEFGAYVVSHPEVDRELDARQVEIARGGGVLLEGRLSGYMVGEAGLDVLRVWLDAAEEIRHARVARREGISLAAARTITEERERDEKARYLDFYGFDLYDTSIYDLIIDTGRTPTEDVVRRILASM
ncbi:MAG: (d)CMP kinase [Pseudomonadota bacterium]